MAHDVSYHSFLHYTLKSAYFAALLVLVPMSDNPAFEGVFEFCSISAGGSIGALRTPSHVQLS
jgi:hypothetical protein